MLMAYSRGLMLVRCPGVSTRRPYEAHQENTFGFGLLENKGRSLPEANISLQGPNNSGLAYFDHFDTQAGDGQVLGRR